MTGCEEPYIGDESIRRPPPRKKARITSAHSSRSSGSSPTLKVIQVPRPTTGIRSPLDGIGLVRGSARAKAVSGRSAAAAAPAATAPRRARRVRGRSDATMGSVEANAPRYGQMGGVVSSVPLVSRALPRRNPAGQPQPTCRRRAAASRCCRSVPRAAHRPGASAPPAASRGPRSSTPARRPAGIGAA